MMMMDALPPLELPSLSLSIFAVAAVSYLSLVRLLRWRRYNAIHKQYGPRWDAWVKNGSVGPSPFTPSEAQAIKNMGAYYDMPLVLGYALSFALFKTYAIPSISKILLATKELADQEKVSKRIADTEILISTWNICPINDALDPRANIAIARVNWLHSRYPIRNDDFVYTLSLFISEPIKWSHLYGWRGLSPMEEHATIAFWLHVGEKMGITGIPGSLKEMREWVEDYEQKHMVSATPNQLVADYTVEELIHTVPNMFGLKSFARRLAFAGLEDRVRIAMLKPSQPGYMRIIFSGILHAIGFIQRNLALPRRNPGGIVNMALPGDDGRMTPKWFQPTPFYKPIPTNPFTWLRERFLVLIGRYKSMPSQGLRGAGYRLHELGPMKWEHTGQHDTLKMAEQLHGCPISGVWAVTEDSK